MEQYNVTGMSCAACAARVEKAVRAVPGVESCAVSLLTNSMGVEGAADPATVVAAVTKAGYGASLKTTSCSGAQCAPPNTAPGSGAQYAPQAPADALADTETPKLKKRLFWSLGFLLVLMYFSMGHMMWGFPLPRWFEGNHVAMGLVQLLLAGIVMVINQRFFVSGFRALLHRAPNMDTLVALGSAASFGWSVWVLFAMTRAQTDGDLAAVEKYMMEFYFESAAMILTLITVGKMLEAKSKGRTTDALKGLMKLAPQTATVLRDGAERSVPVAQVRKDELFIVRPGEAVPVDGVVVEGSSAVNEAALTGESVPVDKAVGDPLSSGSVNQSGWLKARATRVGEDTTLNQIIKLVSDAAATKAPIAKTADKVSGIFVPAVICVAVLVTGIWLLLGRDFGYALARGISVLVISCPCALGLATPVAIMVGSGVGAKNGILFKTAVSLEQTGKVKLVALDKTGTITTGEPAVTDLLPAEGVTEEELLAAALALESRSEHPLAKAIVAFAQGSGIRDQGSGENAVGAELEESRKYAYIGPPGAAEATGNRQQATGDGGCGSFDSAALRSGRQNRDIAAVGAASGRPPEADAFPACHSERSEESALPAITDFHALPGNGLEAMFDGKPLIGGSVKFVSERLNTVGAGDAAKGMACASEQSSPAPSAAVHRTAGAERAYDGPRHESACENGASGGRPLQEHANALANQGKTPVLFAHGERLLGLIAVADVLKPESPAAVRELRDLGLKVIMLTGDNRRTAEAIAAQAGVDEVIAEVLPAGKEAVIRELQQRGPVLMVGDGVNDAPALTRAEVGVAIGAGADVAIDAADVVLMKSKLTDVPAALRLSRATLRNIRENLFWAFIYNAIGIPLAAGAFIKAFGWTLNPMFGAAAMSLSSFCVVTNALRLNLVKLHRDDTRQPVNEADRGTKIKVKGMMCHNCERHVREALEALPGVESAEANFETGLVTLRGAASEAEMKAAVKAAGYKFQKIVK